MRSDRVRDALRSGVLRETWDVCKWVIDFEAYRTLTRAQST